MDLPKYIHDPHEKLPKTLASRVSFLRNARRIHIAELSLQTKVPIKLLEDIEAGIETWLPTSVRQRISIVLKVDPKILEVVEVKNKKFEGLYKEPPGELVERICTEILEGVNEIKCPTCGGEMKTWIQDGFDLNGEPIKTPKGYCKSCVFQIRV